MRTFLLLVLIPSLGLAQKTELTKFLIALKTPEFSESQEVITSLSLKEKAEYYTLKDFTIISNILFKTDIAGISGYKSIIQANATNKAGSYKDARFLVIQYIDKTDKKWKIYAIVEALDPCEKAAYLERHLENSIDNPMDFFKQKVIYNTMCGKLKAALSESDALKKQIRKDPSIYFPYEEDKALSKIVGD